MSTRLHATLLLFLLLIPADSAFSADGGLILFPAKSKLFGSDCSQQLLLHQAQGEMVLNQVQDEILWQSSDPAVATVDEKGTVRPVNNGQVVITAKRNEQTASAEIIVEQADQHRPWTFRNDVLPILSKHGCNMGACHGALAGKGGFRLSLGAYDPETDFFNIVKQDRGRRTEFAAPAESLILTKPSGGLPHKGGLRIDTESRDYRIIAEWIANGAAGPEPMDARIQTLSIFPALSQLVPGNKQQMMVTAQYTDGRMEDVTRWVKWTSANDAVCQITQQGEVTVIGPGEGALTAWFSSSIAVARVTVPFPGQVPDDVYAQLQPRNFIDEEINRELKRLNLPPSPQCDDATFIRRASIDTIGLPPTIEETRRFLADTAPDKRDKLIDALLERPEFVDYWTYKWSDVLMLNGTLLRPMA
ncbi:MAG TPA: DUF1549 domain-containing protein, partial [Planctomicrobium sp.]|nr:DUF1549 domain-containing protein [Planctomicrobium sp.]